MRRRFVVEGKRFIFSGGFVAGSGRRGEIFLWAGFLGGFWGRSGAGRCPPVTFRDPAYLLTHWVFMRAMHRSDPGASLLRKAEAETIGWGFAGSWVPVSMTIRALGKRAEREASASEELGTEASSRIRASASIRQKE